MRLDLLSSLNAERAARRAVMIVTNMENGEQRLVREGEIENDGLADALTRAVKGADKAAIVSARVFDVFTGAGVEPGTKSVALEIVLQPGEKSFTDADLKAISDKVVAAAAKQGATLRG